jgi:GT2 family glycosyltransferase
VAAAFLDPLGYAYSFLTTHTIFVTFGEAVAIAVKSEVIQTIGDLDEDYFIEYEDQDFCWRALLFGFKILFVHNATVTHYRGSVEKPNFFARGRRVFLYTRNHISTLIKNLEFHNLLKYLPAVLAIEFCKGLFVLFGRRNFSVSMKIFRGIFSPFAHLSSLSRKRHTIQQNRKISDKDVLKSFVSFMPRHQLNYLKYQGEGKRYVIDDALFLADMESKHIH